MPGRRTIAAPMLGAAIPRPIPGVAEIPRLARLDRLLAAALGPRQISDLARRHTSCEKLPALPRVPNQSHRIETVGGLLDEQGVFAGRAQRPQREWFEIRAHLQKR
jgi:hypothetical protein